MIKIQKENSKAMRFGLKSVSTSALVVLMLAVSGCGKPKERPLSVSGQQVDMESQSGGFGEPIGGFGDVQGNPEGMSGQTGTPGGTPTDSGTPAGAPVATAAPSLSIACPTSAIAGQAVTCAVSGSSEIVSGYWTVNDEKYEGSDNRYGYSWSNVPVGTFKIRAIGFDAAGKQYNSQSIFITIKEETQPMKMAVTIACPSSAKAGQIVSCGASFTGAVASGYWMLNGEKLAGSDNLTTVSLSHIPAGTYSFQAVVYSTDNAKALSQVLTVTVQ